MKKCRKEITLPPPPQPAHLLKTATMAAADSKQLEMMEQRINWKMANAAAKAQQAAAQQHYLV